MSPRRCLAFLALVAVVASQRTIPLDVIYRDFKAAEQNQLGSHYHPDFACNVRSDPRFGTPGAIETRGLVGPLFSRLNQTTLLPICQGLPDSMLEDCSRFPEWYTDVRAPVPIQALPAVPYRAFVVAPPVPLVADRLSTARLALIPRVPAPSIHPAHR